MTLTGSIEMCESTDKKMEFTLLNADFSSLPTEGVTEGSTALVLDTKKVYVFHKKSLTWYEQ